MGGLQIEKKLVILQTITPICKYMKEIFSKRLINARKIRCMSLRMLSERMDGMVSANALKKYEKGEMLPSSRVLIKLSSALQMKIDDFFQPFSIGEIDLSEVKYRKRASLSKKEQESINAQSSLKLEKYIEVERMCGEDRPFFLNYYDDMVGSENDVLSIAARFRKDLNLGNAPISNPIEIFESIGVKIIEVDVSSKFDGDSFTVNNIFVIVLNKAFKPERKRFSLFHEMGHKVMRFAEGVDEERFCNVFANEVLLPNDVFIQKIGRIRKDISLVELKELQRQYGISVEAMMVKARQVGIISKNRYESFYKHKNRVSTFKDKVEESVFPCEESNRYERLVFKLLANGEITESKCASLLDRKVVDVREDLNLV